MRIVVEGEFGVLDEVEVTSAALLRTLLLAATHYPQARLYVDGCEVDLQKAGASASEQAGPSESTCPSEPAPSFTPMDLADVQQVAHAMLWSSFKATLEAEKSLRAESQKLTEQTLAQNQMLVDASTAQREEHRKALKAIGALETTRLVLAEDMKQRQWKQAQREVRPSILAEVGRDAISACMGALMQSARQFAGDAMKGETDGK